MMKTGIVTTIWVFLLALIVRAAFAQQPSVTESNYLGWFTNGPAFYKQYRMRWDYPGTNGAWIREPRSVLVTNGDSITTNQTFRLLRTNVIFNTNNLFQGFLPDTLNHHIWTNFIAHTNDRSTRIWSLRWHPRGWPTNPPAVMWNTNSLMWGMRGMTAISPCWQNEGSSGQVPITALTRRHGYARGHGMGTEGVSPYNNGMKVWFVTTSNTLVEATVANAIVRCYGTRKADYTIFIFKQDLPESIQSMRVVALTNAMAKYPSAANAPWPIFKTEQGGHVSAGVTGFIVDTWKGGDSGSPDMLPMTGELVFFAGRSTSGPSAEMQEDMDELCRLAKLDPKKYQMQWVNLSGFPTIERK